VWIDIEIITILSRRAACSSPDPNAQFQASFAGKHLVFPHIAQPPLVIRSDFLCLDMNQASQAKAKKADHQTHVHMLIVC
jgi:hypothetical protein